MNATSRAILQTVMATDDTLSPVERTTLQRLMDGLSEARAPGAELDKLLVTQRTAAELISVNRVTIWRMAKECLLHPVEILPGTWRYPYRELSEIADRGIRFAGTTAPALRTS